MKHLQLVKVAAKCKTVTGKVLKKGDEALRFSSDRTTGEIYIITREEIIDALSKLVPIDLAPKYTQAQIILIHKKAQETRKSRESLRKIYNGIKDELSKHNITCSKPTFVNGYVYQCIFYPFSNNKPIGNIQLCTDRIITFRNGNGKIEENITTLRVSTK
jgi:hypothetical protein